VVGMGELINCTLFEEERGVAYGGWLMREMVMGGGCLRRIANFANEANWTNGF
jgi:hypothetical protein